MPDPTFTLEHDEQTWRVQDENGVAIYLIRYGDGKVTLTPALPINGSEWFRFVRCDPNVALAIGRLIVAAARKAGADAA